MFQPVPHAAQSMQDEPEDEFAGFDVDTMQKDENELELEKLVFGDQEGFHRDLDVHADRHITPHADTVEASPEVELDDAEIEGLDDADVRNIDPLLPNPVR